MPTILSPAIGPSKQELERRVLVVEKQLAFLKPKERTELKERIASFCKQHGIQWKAPRFPVYRGEPKPSPAALKRQAKLDQHKARRLRRKAKLEAKLEADARARRAKRQAELKTLREMFGSPIGQPVGRGNIGPIGPKSAKRTYRRFSSR